MVTQELSQTAASPSLRAWVGFLAQCVALFMAVLDIQIVASSLPDIQMGLGLAFDQLSWIQTAYLSAEIVAIPLTGLLTRALSTHRLFVAGVLGFTIASAACAAAMDFHSLIIARSFQGFCGGIIIPMVFSTGYRLFPPQMQGRATIIAGAFAMVAPTLGPALGGYITEVLSWHWLFLINVLPGLAVAAIVSRTIRIDVPRPALLRRVDVVSVLLMASSLVSLELAMKFGPERGWSSVLVVFLLVWFATAGVLAVVRSLGRAEPVVDFRLFKDRDFAIGCCFSFALGAALYGSTYLLPLFLGLVRLHDSLEIGSIMIVTGAAQLLVAPLVPPLERRIDARVLTGVGFVVFAAGLWLSVGHDPRSDFHDAFWPQVLRGAATMLCILPPTTLALAYLPAPKVGDGSALFNMMRNLGGAIGLGIVDTILRANTEAHGLALADRLVAGSREAAAFVGLPLDRFHDVPIGPVDEATRQMVEPMVRRAAMTMSFSEAWAVLAIIMVATVVLLPLIRKQRPPHDMPPVWD